MSPKSGIGTFVMCILFNIILPTGDVSSDLNLMYQTLTFNLGGSLELAGCKSCYHKTEQDIYYSEKDLTSNECKTCLYDRYSNCGQFPSFLTKVSELEREAQTCSSNLTFRVNHDGQFKIDKFEEYGDLCWVTQTKHPKSENPIVKLDPRKSFSCEQLTQELDYCFVSGKESGFHCENFRYNSEFIKQRNERKMLVETLSTNETISFYPYSRINETIVMEKRNRSITDSAIECGLLIFRHDNKYSEQRQGIFRYNHHYNEDSCLTHLRYLHRFTSINELTKWSNDTDFAYGVKVGGKTCRLLQIYGISTLLPILLNLCFNIVLFVNDFQNQKANFFEIIPLVLLFYPQYKTIKFLARYLIHGDENQLNKDKEENDRAVASLEPFLESCLQVRNQINC